MKFHQNAQQVIVISYFAKKKMPLIQSDYQPSFIFKNGHFSTIYSAKLRTSPGLIQKRERVTLPDHDFIDIDWSHAKQQTKKVAILLHGLEGNAQRIYIKGAANALLEDHWDIAAMNFRGCSGENNTRYQSYHSGKTDDLESIINHILEKDHYQEIVLVGFSLGANLLLKYLGERETVPKEIKKGVAISAPTSLRGSLESLNKPENLPYRTVFLISLRKKYQLKMKQHPDKMFASELNKIKSLKDFDDSYTSKAHGFKDAYDYYKINSSNQFLPNIKVPVLILNAKNDSFLNPDCFPFEIAKNSENVFLETPMHGGHVGFHLSKGTYYSEKRTVSFLKNKFSKRRDSK
ncbi:MAG: putative alpha/beta-fold hydrolase [Flavobacteriaceae bacterium]